MDVSHDALLESSEETELTLTLTRYKRNNSMQGQTFFHIISLSAGLLKLKMSSLVNKSSRKLH